MGASARAKRRIADKRNLKWPFSTQRHIMEETTFTKLRRDLVFGPVTALAFFSCAEPQLYVLAGIDTHLALYDVRGSQLRGRFRIFKASVIHGIYLAPAAQSQDGGYVLVWGAQSVAVFPRACLESVLGGHSPPTPVEVQASDWVYDGLLSPWDPSEGVLVTAHNEVVPFRIHDGDTVALAPPRSPTRPILFSATSSWEDRDRVLVAAGSAFGEIVVWVCSLAPPPPPPAAEEACRILHVFRGHEGSVFGVALSPVVGLGPGGTRARLLASCSDDRTVRVWDVSEHAATSAAAAGSQVAKRPEVRETGFTNALAGMSEAAAAAEEEGPGELAVIMGHLSRIWNIKFFCRPLPAGAGHAVSVYSFGEDATAQEWRLYLDPDRWPFPPAASRGPEEQSQGGKYGRVGTLTHVRTIPCHSGKHIWAACVLDRPAGPSVIATGGADGKINLIGEPSRTGDSPPGHGNYVASVTVSQVVASLERLSAVEHPGESDSEVDSEEKTSKKGREQHFFCSFAFLSRQEVIAATSLGRLFVFRVGSSLDWTEISLDPSVTAQITGYSRIKRAASGTALIGTASGCVFAYVKPGRVVEVVKLPAKIEEFFVLPRLGDADASTADQTGEGGTKFQVLVKMLLRNDLMVLDISVAGPGTVTTSQRALIVDKGARISTANSFQDLLLLGSRTGALYIYRELPSGGFTRVCHQRHPSRDAITTLLRLPASPEDDAPPSFLATYRTGIYQVLEVGSDGSGGIHIASMHESSCGLNIPDAWFAKSDTGVLELIFSGFRGTCFQVWNETQQQKISAIDCGGFHRAYAHHADVGDASWLRFAYTKGTTLHFYSQTMASHRAVKAGGHGREIRAVSSCGEYIATCGEDTAIRIWKMDGPRGPFPSNLRCLATMTQHVGGVQCLKWLGREYLLSSGGSEELFVWRVSSLRSAYEGLAVARESAVPWRSRDGDLRITSFDVDAVAPSGGDGSDGGGGMLVSLVLSNSTLRTCRYRPGGAWQLVAEGRYTGACPTQIRHLAGGVDDGDGAREVLAAFTDGAVTVWRAAAAAGGDYVLVHAVRPHRSAIKGLAVARLGDGDEGGLVAVTGGDDNALAVSILRRRGAGDGGGFGFGGSFRVGRAHAAAITGVRVLRAGGDKVVAMTCSNDQRVKTWRIRLETGRGGVWRVGGVQLLDDQYSSVADPGDMELLDSHGRLMVVGVGMETWELPRCLTSA